LFQRGTFGLKYRMWLRWGTLIACLTGLFLLFWLQNKIKYSSDGLSLPSRSQSDQSDLGPKTVISTKHEALASDERLCADASQLLTFLYWSPTHNLAWCKVPKAGSSTWVDNFFKLAEAKQGSTLVPKGQDAPHLGLRKHFPKVRLSDVPTIANSSLLFMVVRHPLDRFLASFRDKIEKGNNTYYKGLFGTPTWPTFVDRMLGTPAGSWDEHWAPMQFLCPPCARFHVVARMESFNEDTEYIISRAKLNHLLNVEWKNKNSAGSHFQRHLSYYRQLSVEQVEGLVEAYRRDFILYNYDPEPYRWMAQQGKE